MSDLGTGIRSYYEQVVERVDPTAPPIPGSPRRAVTTRAGIGLAVVVGVVVLLVVGVVALLPSSDPDPLTPPVTDPTSTTSPPATTTPASEASVTTSTDTQPLMGELPAPPWSADFLTVDRVDPLMLDAWSRASNRGYCALLAPADLGPEGSEAAVRIAGFTPELEWYIAWDSPNGPGMTGNSELCEDCGRSAFGIYGNEMLSDSADPTWSDGSSLTIHPQDGSYEDGHQRVLGNLVVAGQPCAYQVWSSYGSEHLRWFVDQLRFVEDHYAEPLDTAAGEVEVISLGTPGWRGPPLAEDDVDSLLLDRWNQADQRSTNRACPLIALADLGPNTEDATIRTANFGGWGVAWDSPSGPGHDGLNQPCSDCGRGFVGLSGGRGSLDAIPPGRPYRAEWDDGSYAIYGYEGNLFNQVPSDRIDLRDPITGDPATPPLHAWVEPADQPGCFYEIWTHLGQDHLHYLFTQLRYVAGYP